MTAPHQPTAPKAYELPDPATLTGWQLRGYQCALCRTWLAADRPLGIVKVTYGGKVTEQVELWACRPYCPPEAAHGA